MYTGNPLAQQKVEALGSWLKMIYKSIG